MIDRVWEEIEQDVYRLTDSCNVYLVRGPRGVVLVNAGTGLAAEHLHPMGADSDLCVLLTHCFRDHSAGAVLLSAHGAKVMANYWDREFYTNGRQYVESRETWVSYDNRWDRFCPLEPIPVSDWLKDYAEYTIAGLRWEVIPTPGVTLGASSYVVTMPSGRRLAFVGETIAGHGRLSRLAPLQYNYNDMPGAVNVWHSCDRLLKAAVERVLPSVGEPIDDPDSALLALRSNIARIDEIIPGFAGKLTDRSADGYSDIEQVLPHLFFSRESGARTHFAVSDSNRMLALDYGYNETVVAMPGPSSRITRRPLLHGMDGLKARFGIERIDATLVSHYHDDHICGIPLLQRLYGTEVYAGTCIADILEHPERYDLPCLWPEPVHVSHPVPSDSSFEWEGIRFALHDMSGHTRYSTLICFEIDGTRIVHTGDQIFFDPWEFAPGARMFTNHVYKNGLELGCYLRMLEHLREFRPELVLSGHAEPYRTCPEWYESIERGAKAFDEVHRLLMYLGDDEVHFGAESQAGKLCPYRIRARAGETFTVGGWILNPFPAKHDAAVALDLPEGWTSTPVELSLAPREKKDFTMALAIPESAPPGRHVIGLDLSVGTRRFGQVAEGFVTVIL